MGNIKQIIASREEYVPIKENFNVKDEELKKELESDETREVVLLYIDIANFTEKYGELKEKPVLRLLTEYYKNVLSIIYQEGGVVERLTGDGIICVFGEPFLKEKRLSEYKNMALECAEKIINECKGSEFEVKIAFHYGDIMYHYFEICDYSEFTMIGNTLTELYRLESVSEVNTISFYKKDYPFENEEQAKGKYLLTNINDFNSKNRKPTITSQLKIIQSFGEEEIVFHTPQ